MSVTSMIQGALVKHLPQVAIPLGPEANRDDQQVQARQVGAAALGKDTISQSLGLLAKYIPADVMALYLSTISVIPLLSNLTYVWIFTPSLSFSLPLAVYLIFIFPVTPLFVLLLFLRGRKVLRLGLLPKSWNEWPIWETAAAMIAFAAWGLAIPNGIITDKGWIAAVGVLAMFVSLLLSRLGELISPD